ncbi:MAG: hypothetical protein MZV70_00640 [Desulfobacterales bacterium]|nr:hypothetical protein [Desulfobacterales bacterium]
MLYLSALGLGLGAFIREIDGMPYVTSHRPRHYRLFIDVFRHLRVHLRHIRKNDLPEDLRRHPRHAGQPRRPHRGGASLGRHKERPVRDRHHHRHLPLRPRRLSPRHPHHSRPLFSGLIFAEISVMAAAIVPGIESFNCFYTLLMTPMFSSPGIFFPQHAAAHGRPDRLLHPPLSSREHLPCLRGGEAPLSAATDLIWIIAIAALLSPYPFRLMRRRIIKAISTAAHQPCVKSRGKVPQRPC